MQKRIILLLARNYAQARECAERHRLDQSDWAYISGPLSIVGLRNAVVWRVGDYYCRDDLHSVESMIERAIQTQGFTEQYEPDVLKEVICAQQ